MEIRETFKCISYDVKFGGQKISAYGRPIRLETELFSATGLTLIDLERGYYVDPEMEGTKTTDDKLKDVPEQETILQILTIR